MIDHWFSIEEALRVGRSCHASDAILDAITDIARKEVAEAKLGGFHLYSDARAEADVKRLGRELDAERAAHAETRKMFDVTRHRICDALGIEHGKSWSSVESIIAETRKELESSKADAGAFRQCIAHIAWSLCLLSDDWSTPDAGPKIVDEVRLAVAELAETRKELEVMTEARKQAENRAANAEARVSEILDDVFVNGEDGEEWSEAFSRCNEELAETREGLGAIATVAEERRERAKKAETELAETKAKLVSMTGSHKLSMANLATADRELHEAGARLAFEREAHNETVANMHDELQETKAKLNSSRIDLAEERARISVLDMRVRLAEAKLATAVEALEEIVDGPLGNADLVAAKALRTLRGGQPKPEYPSDASTPATGPEPAKCTCADVCPARNEAVYHCRTGCVIPCSCTWDGQS